MILDKTNDPRHPVDRLSRQELRHLARYENRTDIDPEMPANLMRQLFKDRPPSRFPRPMRANLGSQMRLIIPPYKEWLVRAFSDDKPTPERPEVVETDATADLMRQWESEKRKKIDYSTMKFLELRKACSERGIKWSRTDKKDALLAKLNGENTS